MNCFTRQVLLVLSIGFLLLSASNSLHTQGSAPPVANQIGRLTSSGNGLRRTVYEYDELGRTTRTVNNFEGQSKAFNTGYGYPVNLTTAIGPGTVPTSQTFPDNERVDYTYDTSGAQQSIKTTPAGGSQQTIVHSIFRNSRGQTIAASYGNGAISIYKYNEATNLRLNQIQTAVGGTLSFTGGVPHLSGGTTLQNYGYSFDNNGNVIGVTDGVSTALNATYGYDSLDQLSSMTPAGQVLLPYSYDQLGNLTNKENVVQAYGGAQSCAGCAPNRGPHALASASGVTYNYDFNGNLVSTSNGTNLTSIITWNAENMATSVVQNGSLKYQKSFVGESLWKKVEPGSITHYLPSLRIENGLARKFFGSFAERSPDGSLKFYHGDHLGSASLVTNPAGAMIRRQAYKPYGADRFIDPAGTFTPKYQFTFKEKEETTGFYDYGARLYNPFTGRWLSADTFTVDGLNRYAYVRNNPLRFNDPTGHCSAPAGLQPGQIGICLEQFIAADRFKVVGYGDNRTFSGTDIELSARGRVFVVLSPTKSDDGQTVYRFDDVKVVHTESGYSTIGPAKSMRVGSKGAAEVRLRNFSRLPWPNAPEFLKFTLSLSSKSGFYGVAMKLPVDTDLAYPIDTKLTVTMKPGGKLKIRGSTDAYPSIGVYSYTVGADGQIIMRTHSEMSETDPSALAGPGVPLQRKRKDQ